MSSARIVSQKPTFLAELTLLPSKDVAQVVEKIHRLALDPKPDGKIRKALSAKKYEGVCRLRCGDWRLLYTYDDSYVSLLSIRRRDDQTYDDDGVEAEHLGGLDADLPEPAPPPTFEAMVAPPPREPKRTLLPQSITVEILQALRIPEGFHPALLGLTTQEELFGADAVPEDVRLRVDEALFSRPLDEILAQPNLVAQSADDLLRYREGELLGFLLRLDPEQERLVSWAVTGKGATLVKGGPGTGKSTVAIYRCRSILDTLPAEPAPRILFTTYTNALVAFTRQLLQQLLGERASQVDVRTADSVAREIVDTREPVLGIADHSQQVALVREAIETATYPGNEMQISVAKSTIARLGGKYVSEEIDTILEGRGLTLEGYLAARRPGRRFPLHPLQRSALWAVYEQYKVLREAKKLQTWGGLRRRAADTVSTGSIQEKDRYDAIVVDEAQDLSVSTLQMLAGLCRRSNGLFVTADADQSIYGSGFAWTEVHENLRFQGRTATLRRNYRSTAEIDRAARSYLSSSALDEPETGDEALPEILYSHSGGPLPAVRVVASLSDEAALVSRFLQGACRELRLPRGACAVLVPSETAGKALAAALTERGTPAEFMKGKDLNLRSGQVLVLPLKSAKGLEFPVVTLAGFGAGKWPILPRGVAPEVLDESIAVERRILFVAMTRAMRALLLVVPASELYMHGDLFSNRIPKNPLFVGFSPGLWNLA